VHPVHGATPLGLRERRARDEHDQLRAHHPCLAPARDERGDQELPLFHGMYRALELAFVREVLEQGIGKPFGKLLD